MHNLINFASLLVLFFTAVPRVPKLSILMQALFCAHWEHSRSTQTHQGEETQEEHNGLGTFTFVSSLIPGLVLVMPLQHYNKVFNVFSGSGFSGETGGEWAACPAAPLCCPAEGRGHGGSRYSEAARDLKGGLWGSESRGHQDGRDHKEEPLRLFADMSLSLCFLQIRHKLLWPNSVFLQGCYIWSSLY